VTWTRRIERQHLSANRNDGKGAGESSNRADPRARSQDHIVGLDPRSVLLELNRGGPAARLHSGDATRRQDNPRVALRIVSHGIEQRSRVDGSVERVECRSPGGGEQRLQPTKCACIDPCRLVSQPRSQADRFRLVKRDLQHSRAVERNAPPCPGGEGGDVLRIQVASSETELSYRRWRVTDRWCQDSG
jgi:hypothetical protein